MDNVPAVKPTECKAPRMNPNVQQRLGGVICQCGFTDCNAQIGMLTVGEAVCVGGCEGNGKKVTVFPAQLCCEPILEQFYALKKEVYLKNPTVC